MPSWHIHCRLTADKQHVMAVSNNFRDIVLVPAPNADRPFKNMPLTTVLLTPNVVDQYDSVPTAVVGPEGRLLLPKCQSHRQGVRTRPLCASAGLTSIGVLGVEGDRLILVDEQFIPRGLSWRVTATPSSAWTWILRGAG
jgi:hypothetical protein